MDCWSFEENKAFENAIAELGNECPTLFQEIALRVPGKSIEQIQMHYAELVRDLEIIENGFLDDALDGFDLPKTEPNMASNATPSRVLRKRGTPWTEAEHEAFLVGLEKYGKGDWKSISRYCVKTRTPTQVASHAQKYFEKLRKFTQQEAEAKLLAGAASSAAANDNVNR
ncbi:hypothetical protein Cgig2_029733 [Carnegiea gigantea]|uniref:Uncharacterized protein n=1 Tax=Carnegiea gigantea TaxID=171969 RepID=A0A9Q1GQB4_9CARY|nr:hypothetical protein Cgig2_029733 [Carnegiea gigantea]